MKLNTAALSQNHVKGPQYDRSALRPGIVHFGMGNFHRAHLAFYLDRLLRDGLAPGWGIWGVGVLPSDIRMRDALGSQDHLYTLVEKHPSGEVNSRIVGSIGGYLFAPDNPDAVVDLIANEAVRIVSLTITEGGYNTDHVTGEFLTKNPQIQWDLKHPHEPKTVFGLITAGLQRRRERGLKPVTIMSCDNIQGNGHIARNSIIGFARLHDAELADWIEENVSFPNSMVDRITPATTDADRDLVRDLTDGIDDLWPVTCEPFEQWVLEDDFKAGRPPFEESGVELVEDVAPYEMMKLRLLNASHQALAYFGTLAGYTYVDEAAEDPLIRELVQRYMDEEASPTLPAIPGTDLVEYKAQLIVRFSNPWVRDTLHRLATDASDRIAKFLLPVVRDNLKSGGQTALSAAIIASWAKYSEGIDDNGEVIERTDPAAERLHAAALTYEEAPLGFVSDAEIFEDLAQQQKFATEYQDALATLHETDSLSALGKLLATSPSAAL